MVPLPMRKNTVPYMPWTPPPKAHDPKLGGLVVWSVQGMYGTHHNPLYRTVPLMRFWAIWGAVFTVHGGMHSVAMPPTDRLLHSLISAGVSGSSNVNG